MRYLSSLLAALTIAFTFTSCTKDSEKKNQGNNVLASENHITLTIDGDSLTIIDGIGGWLNKVGSGGGVVDTNGTYLHREFSEFSNSNGDTLRIYFIELFSNSPTQAQKEAIVSPGTYSLGYGASNSLSSGQAESGVVVTYVSNGVRWSTEYGTQSNYFFEVDSQVVNSANTSKYVTFGRFEATIFDGNGNSMDFGSPSFRAITYRN